MNLFLKFLESFISSNAKNVALLISLILFIMISNDPVFVNCESSISGFHTLGVRGHYIQNQVNSCFS